MDIPLARTSKSRSHKADDLTHVPEVRSSDTAARQDHFAILLQQVAADRFAIARCQQPPQRGFGPPRRSRASAHQLTRIGHRTPAVEALSGGLRVVQRTDARGLDLEAAPRTPRAHFTSLFQVGRNQAFLLQAIERGVDSAGRHLASEPVLHFGQDGAPVGLLCPVRWRASPARARPPVRTGPSTSAICLHCRYNPPDVKRISTRLTERY